MFNRTMLSYISWLSGVFGWVAGALIAIAFVKYMGRAYPGALHVQTSLFLWIVTPGLGRIAVSAIVHGIGSMTLPAQERGAAWLRMMSIGAASPVMFLALLTVQLRPTLLDHDLLQPMIEFHEIVGALVLGTWALGFFCATLAGHLTDLQCERLDAPQEAARHESLGNPARHTGAHGVLANVA